MELKEKVAFITGGASRLRQGHCRKFYCGWSKSNAFRPEPENAEITAKELGENADWSSGDVSNETDITQAILKTKDRFGGMHININSAGIGAAARTLGKNGPMPIQQFEFVIKVNLLGTFNCLRLCANEMKNNEQQTADNERSYCKCSICSGV